MVYVRSEIERASHFEMKFQDRKDPVVTFNEGFAVRLECAHSVPLNWFVPGGGGDCLNNDSEGGDGDADSEKVGKEEREAEVKKDIKGELDIIIVADPSHPVLPG